MSTSDSFKDLQHKLINTLHRGAIAISGGRIGHTAVGMPVVKVTTTGRKSGQPRTVMLTTPVHGDGRHILVASKGGDDRDPDWYRNMVANPEFTLEPIGGEGPITLVARTASEEEKVDLWPKIVAANKGYAGYKEKTDRNIPVVICEPPM